jgi:transcriptional regulator with XRE-family HTH domain
MTIGQNVRNRRQQLGLLQSELAKKSQTNQAQISRVESDKNNISVDLLIRIAKALNCTISDLMEVS